jgi:hypothetical protein
MAGQLYTTGKLAEALGISAGKVKKLLDELKVKEDSVKGACKQLDQRLVGVSPGVSPGVSHSHLQTLASCCKPMQVLLTQFHAGNRVNVS